jgi:hypothetical protein
MTDVENWLRTGAGIQEGLRLLSLYKPNPYLARMVERHPDKYRRLLIRTLAGRDPAPTPADRPARSFREDWPFLSRPDCPPELKILAADKITAWTNFAREHEKLFDCVTPEQCLEHAKNCVFYYQQNRKIFSEFAHYQDTGHVLGKHPVFGEVRRTHEMLSAGPIELMRRQHNLRAAISRLKRQMGTGGRPDLDAGRAELLAAKERELAEVEKILENYEKSYARRSD